MATMDHPKFVPTNTASYNSGRIVVHFDFLDLEGRIVDWRVRSPSRVAIAPIVPNPRTLNVRHIGGDRMLEDAVQEEFRSVFEPVKAVFMNGLRKTH